MALLLRAGEEAVWGKVREWSEDSHPLLFDEIKKWLNCLFHSQTNSQWLQSKAIKDGTVEET